MTPAPQTGLSSKELIHGLEWQGSTWTDEILADLAVTEPEILGAMMTPAKNALDGEPVEHERGGGPVGAWGSVVRRQRRSGRALKRELGTGRRPATRRCAGRRSPGDMSRLRGCAAARRKVSAAGSAERAAEERSSCPVPGAVPAISAARAAKLEPRMPQVRTPVLARGSRCSRGGRRSGTLRVSERGAAIPWRLDAQDPDRAGGGLPVVKT